MLRRALRSERSNAGKSSVVVLGPVGGTSWWQPGVSVQFDFAHARSYFGGAQDTLSSNSLGYLVTGKSWTNLAPWSNALTNAAWVLNNATIGTGVTDPNSGTTAFKIAETATTNTHYAAIESNAFVAGGVVTGSIYLKAAERAFAGVEVADPATANGFAITVDLTTGAVAPFSGSGFTAGVIGTGTFVSASSTNAGNGWWRVNLVGTVGPSATQAFIINYASTALNTVIYAGVAGSGINAWHPNITQTNGVQADTPTNSALSMTAVPSGQTWTLLGSDAASFPTIIGGKLTNASNPASLAAGYLNANIGHNVTRIGGKFVFTGGSTLGGGATFIIWQTDLSTSAALPNSGFHAVVSATGWNYYKVASNTLTQLASGSFVTPLVVDGATQYTFNGTVSGNTATLTMPGIDTVTGTNTVTVTDASVGASPGPFATFEVFQNLATTDDKPGFTQAWAA